MLKGSVLERKSDESALPHFFVEMVSSLLCFLMAHLEHLCVLFCFFKAPLKVWIFFSFAAETLCLLVKLLYRIVCYYMEFNTTQENPVA